MHTKCVTSPEALPFRPPNSVKGPTSRTSNSVGGGMSHLREKHQKAN